MFEREIQRLAGRLGLGDEQVQEIRALVLKAAAMPPSSMSTLVLEEDTAAPEISVALDTLEHHGVGRYDLLTELGTGGMGEVRRVRDTQLTRVVAQKVIRGSLMDRPRDVQRFIEEARTTAQLQHPSIVPVHELGRLADGRVYFTMKEVRGRTLSVLIASVHAASSGERWSPSPQGCTFRKLLGVLHQVCLAVAYAHDRGVIHRDLKPANIMVGEYGEVQLMDWGLARVVGRSVEQVGQGIRRPTGPHTVVGTPAYMAPEQAMGEGVSALADVYSLGAVLYEILAGRAPYKGEPLEVLQRIRRGKAPKELAPSQESLAFAETRHFTAAEGTGRPPIPEVLRKICLRAMAWDPAERYASASAFARDLSAWLDGEERSASARVVVMGAREVFPEAERLRLEAAKLKLRAKSVLGEIPSWAPDEQKEQAWSWQDRAVALEREADLKELDGEAMLRGALNLAPGLEEAHGALAERLRLRHLAAEREGDLRLAEQIEVPLRAHTRALSSLHAQHTELTAYLKGDGRLALETEPAHAKVQLLRYVTTARRLHAVHTHWLHAPLVRQRLAMGSYLLVLSAEGHTEVRYPVFMERQGRWGSTPPGCDLPVPIALPAEGELGPDDVVIPDGWFLAGTREDRRWLWLDGYIMRRFPVTNREYLQFLTDLVAQGREEEALSRAPRERDGACIYGRTSEGGFTLVPDADGDLWSLDWPVILINWSDAQAYTLWLAEREGLAWRLPSEWEVEKAARGVDGRTYPFGDFVDPSWFCNVHAHAERPLLAEVRDFPDDVSPYGVRGLAGNVVEWCLEDYNGPPPQAGTRVSPGPSTEAGYRSVRGGSWLKPPSHGACAMRKGVPQTGLLPDLGFRLVRPYPLRGDE